MLIRGKLPDLVGFYEEMLSIFFVRIAVLIFNVTGASQ